MLYFIIVLLLNLGGVVCNIITINISNETACHNGNIDLTPLIVAGEFIAKDNEVFFELYKNDDNPKQLCHFSTADPPKENGICEFKKLVENNYTFKLKVNDARDYKKIKAYMNGQTSNQTSASVETPTNCDWHNTTSGVTVGWSLIWTIGFLAVVVI